MANRTALYELKDWSQIDRTDPFFSGIDVSRPENFGIHSYNGNLWTSGYVGVGRLFGTNGKPLTIHGKDRAVVINSKFGMDPWKMLEKVMTDVEYDDYISELERDGKYLFKIFYDQPVIKLDQSIRCDADILYALSFINSCYALCKKGIKKKMVHVEENYNAKIRGRIDVQKNIRCNTINGRNDRFYCKFIDFTSDTIENRILKATLVRCKKTIDQKFELNSEIVGRLQFCLNTLKGVRLVTIREKDFNGVIATGLYTYYKPLLKQAKCILSQKYYSYSSDNGLTVSRSVFTVPYMINMETVFEFYVRTIFREMLDHDRYELVKYSNRIFTEKGVVSSEDSLHRIHMMSYCIPDVVIVDKTTGLPAYVFDAKYKPHEDSVRNDSHQLLSYVLLTGVSRCGFIFPGTDTKVKTMRNQDYLLLTTSFIPQLNYYELILGNPIDVSEINKLWI